MTNLEHTLEPRFSVQFSPSTFLMRLGSREIFVCRDFRKRHYQVNPVIECSTGVQAKAIYAMMVLNDCDGR